MANVEPTWMFRGGRALRGLAVAAAVGLVGNAAADIPTIKLQSGAPVTPSQAWTFYGSPVSPAISTSPRPPEIKALARALSRGGLVTGDAFADRVATYVRRNIETEFRFGLGKGARGAAIDQYGTPFDQAQLMVEILREGGMAASYRLGTITLTPAQFGKWTGLVTGLNQATQSFSVRAQAACQMLADGGIPAIVNNNSSVTSCSSTFGASTNMTTVTLGHVWVLANGKVYDPSHKPKLLRTGIDVAAALQCGTASSPTCGSQSETQAMTGALTGTQFTAAYIERVNRTALETQLQTYATRLETAIAALTGGRELPIEDVVGGGVMDDNYAPGILTTLPYTSATQATWDGEIPDVFRTTFKVTLLGLNSGNGVTLFADQLAGKRMRITSVALPNSWQRTTKLYVDGVAVGTGVVTTAPQQQDRPLLTINYPYAANAAGGTANGTYGDDSITVAGPFDARDANSCYHPDPNTTICGVGYQQIYTVLLNLGQSGPGQEQSAARIRSDGLESAMYADLYTAADPLFALPPPASPLFVQSTAATRLLGALTKSTITTHHSMGLLFMSYSPGDGQHYFNVESAVSVDHSNNDTAWRTAAFNSYSSVVSALEGSIRQQSQDSFESASSVSIFKLFNDANRRFFEATSTTMLNSVLASSQNYSTATQNILRSYTTDGYSIILPLNALLGTVNLSSGTVYYAMTPEFAFKTNRASPLINSEYKGGGANPGLDPNKTFVQNVEANTYSAKKRDYWSFDLASGTLSLAPPPDLSVGVPGMPGSLQFARTYSSNTGDGSTQCYVIYGAFPSVTVSCTPLRGGNSQVGGNWDFNLSRRASWSTNALEVLGQTTALRAAGSIARLFAIADINRTSSFRRRMTSLIANYSLINSFMRNSVTVELPPQSYTFIKLPSGAFDPPATAKGASVTISGAPSAPFVIFGKVLSDYGATTITFTGSDGAVTTFRYGLAICGLTGNFECVASPSYVARETILPSGVQEKFTYDDSISSAEGKELFVLKSIATSKGNQINLVYPAQQGTSSGTLDGVLFSLIPTLGSVNDGSGRTAQMTCGIQVLGDYCLTNGATFTDVVGGATHVTYGPAPGSPSWGAQYAPYVAGTWYTPLNASTPYLRFDYDTVLHLKSVTDIAGKTTDMWVASVSDERWRLGESRDPLGNITSTEFDRYGRPLKVTDPLSRVTRNTYDNAGRLLRVDPPGGGATEYQYDARGNRTRECRIAVERGTANCNTSMGDLAVTTTYVDGPTVLATQCANRKTCNRPLFVVDARGNRTDYAWSGTHGDLTQVLGPADGAGLRPQTDYGYVPQLGTDSQTFYVLTSKTEKIDASSSVVTTYGYETSANRFALKEQVQDSGGYNLRSCFKFDSVGNLISQTQPKAALGSCP